MKKVIISVLFLLVCLSILLITTNAKEDVDYDFNKEYALNLIDKAYQIYLTTNEISPTSGSSSGDGFYYDSENKNSPYYDPLNETMLYGSSLAEWNKAVDEIFTPQAAKKARSAYIDPSCPLFIEKDGVVYIAWGVGQRIYFSISYESIDDIELTIIEKDENKVNAKIKIWIPGDYWETPDIEAYVTCVFEYSGDSWRIGDCAFTDMITSTDFEWTPVESPSTGDVSGERVAMLGAVSLACIIPAACLTLRRRRVLV